MRTTRMFWTLAAVLLCCGQHSAQQPEGASPGDRIVLPNDASSYTRRANRQVLRQLDFDNRDDYKDSLRGLIKRFDGKIPPEDGSVWNLEQYNFLNKHIPQNAPLTVNPSLWREAQLNIIGGLFEVYPDKIYQLRAFDLSNMSLIRGKEGWIVIDPLITEQAANTHLIWFRCSGREGKAGRARTKCNGGYLYP